jgi:hypothetical protein
MSACAGRGVDRQPVSLGQTAPTASAAPTEQPGHVPPEPTQPNAPGLPGAHSTAAEPTARQSEATQPGGGPTVDAPPDEVRPLDDHRRGDFGLPTDGRPVRDLPPLTEAQWSDPAVVAVRYVLADTNYSSTESPSVVAARRAVYASEYLMADAMSTGGAAALEDQRRRHVVSVGEVLGVATVVAGDRATATLTVRRTTLVEGDPSATARIGFQRLTLVRHPVSGRWLVVSVVLS